jgi:hypothetical protein
MFRTIFSPIFRSAWLYLQYLVTFINVAAGWCHGWYLKSVPTYSWLTRNNKLIYIVASDSVQQLHGQQPSMYAKPEAISAVLGSWWWAVCRRKHVELHVNIKQNFDTLLHLVGFPLWIISSLLWWDLVGRTKKNDELLTRIVDLQTEIWTWYILITKQVCSPLDSNDRSQFLSYLHSFLCRGKFVIVEYTNYKKHRVGMGKNNGVRVLRVCGVVLFRYTTLRHWVIAYRNFEGTYRLQYPVRHRRIQEI